MWSDGSTDRVKERSYFSDLKVVMKKFEEASATVEQPPNSVTKFSPAYDNYLKRTFESAYTTDLINEADISKKPLSVNYVSKKLLKKRRVG